jgi:hypothetical protein
VSSIVSSVSIGTALRTSESNAPPAPADARSASADADDGSIVPCVIGSVGGGRVSGDVDESSGAVEVEVWAHADATRRTAAASDTERVAERVAVRVAVRMVMHVQSALGPSACTFLPRSRSFNVRVVSGGRLTEGARASFDLGDIHLDEILFVGPTA